MKKKLVIIGNGMASVHCVEQLLKQAPDAYDVTILSSEKTPGYNRILLASILSGEKRMEDIVLHPEEWYREQGVKLHLDQKVEKILRHKKEALTEDGSSHSYDKLIIATGSLPLALNVPGIEKKGVFTFRSLRDCESLSAFPPKGKRAVVVGGGLLGLETAWSLKKLGMETTVVHIMDRLMERQLDETSASLLLKRLREIGVKVLLEKKTVEVLGDESVQGVRFHDETELLADLVVQSMGIRPNIELAQSSGIYCERGIVVSDVMQTYDPSAYAIGECVQHRGRTFGLVAPIFEQGKVLANHLAGEGRLIYRTPIVSAKLKVPGIELFSVGDFHDNGHDDSISYCDLSSGVYKRLILSDNRIVGAVLIGDSSAGPRIFQLISDQTDIKEHRDRILFGDGGPEKAREAFRIDEMKDDFIVCGCAGVTKGEIVRAIEEKGLFKLEDVRKETGASKSCGGCAPLIERLLESVVGSDYQKDRVKPICECTSYTREDVLNNIREKNLARVEDVMKTLGWKSEGCDICGPALNYYLTLCRPGRYEPDPEYSPPNEKMRANVQSDGAYSVVPRMYGGVADAAQLRRIADTAVKFNVPLVKLTGGQRIALVGVREEQLKPIWKELGMPSGFAYAKSLRTVKTCVGLPYCRYGTQKSMELGIALEKELERIMTPAKVKLGVSGCPRNCAESGIKDIGIVGVKGGWEIYAGGNGGVNLEKAALLAAVQTGEEAVEIVKAFLQLYREEADYMERTSKWISRFGFEKIKKMVVESPIERKELAERLDAALAGLKDPWLY
jgi:nitrite reductase (NADH) large subunit